MNLTICAGSRIHPLMIEQTNLDAAYRTSASWWWPGCVRAEVASG